MLPEKQGKTVQKKLLPRLRFPEFKNDGKWEVKRLGEVFIKINKLVEEDNTASYKPVAVGEKGLRLREEIFDKDLTKNVGKYKVFPFYSVCFGLGSKSLAVAVNDIENSYYCVSNAYKIYKVKNQVNIKLLKYYIELVRNKWGKKILIQSSRQGKSIDENILFDTAIPVPSLPEQQKIAACLSSLDDLITAERQKLELLKAHKKGLLQNLFPQEGETVPKLRFPEFKKDGELEVKRFNQLFEFGNGKDYRHLSKGDIPVYGTGGLMSFVNDYIYDGESVCIGRKGTIDNPIYLTGKFWTVDTLFYTHSFNNCEPKFIYYVFNNINWYDYNEAGGVPSLSKSTISKIDTLIPPSLPEQQKIAACLSSLDDLIAAQTQKIELLQLHKKGLLQGLFPKLEE